jgi:hypothetical protein
LAFVISAQAEIQTMFPPHSCGWGIRVGVKHRALEIAAYFDISVARGQIDRVIPGKTLTFHSPHPAVP